MKERERSWGLKIGNKIYIIFIKKKKRTHERHLLSVWNILAGRGNTSRWWIKGKALVDMEEEERRRWRWRRTQQLKYSGEPNQKKKKKKQKTKKLSPTDRKKRCEHGTTYWGGKEELYTSRKIRKEQQQQLSSVEKEREREVDSVAGRRGRQHSSPLARLISYSSERKSLFFFLSSSFHILSLFLLRCLICWYVQRKNSFRNPCQKKGKKTKIPWLCGLTIVWPIRHFDGTNMSTWQPWHAPKCSNLFFQFPAPVQQRRCAFAIFLYSNKPTGN